MNYCPSCAQEVPASASVCEHCGRPIATSSAPYSFTDEEEYESLPIGSDIEGKDAQFDEEPEQESALLDGQQFASAEEHAQEPGQYDGAYIEEYEPETAVVPPARSPQSSVPVPSRRELFAIAAAIVGGGTITLGILIAASRPSGEPPATTAENISAAAAIPTAQRAAPSGGARWNSGNRAWLGQRRGVAFDLPADNKIAVWQKTVQPTLVVRCLSNQPEVFVFTESAARIETQDENHTVRIGFDEDPEFTERWPDSADHDALFAPDGAAFAQRLMRARTMRFVFTPHNSPSATVSFTVSGLAELLAPVARQCGVRK